jgi:hypothetical protein
VLVGVQFLPNGQALTICEAASSQDRKPAALRVAGVGGCYGPSSYRRSPESLHGGARRHYVHAELEQLRALGPLDVVLFHDAPFGIEFIKRMASGDERRYTSQAEGLSEALAAIRPKLCFFGHHHVRVDAEIEGVRCVGLNAVGHRGSLVAFEAQGDGQVALLGQWP